MKSTERRIFGLSVALAAAFALAVPAGFSTYPLGTFSNAGLLVITALMFIGASPAAARGFRPGM